MSKLKEIRGRKEAIDTLVATLKAQRVPSPNIFGVSLASLPMVHDETVPPGHIRVVDTEGTARLYSVLTET